LTDGGFAYAEPLRLALQQVAWGHPNPLAEGERAPVGDGDDRVRRGARSLPAAVEDRDRDLAPQTIEFTYFTMERGDVSKRKVDPYHLVFRGRAVLLDRLFARGEAVRVFRLSRIQGKSATRPSRARLLAARGLRPPRLRQPRRLAAGETQGRAKIWIRERIAWLIERDFGTYGAIRDAKASARRRQRQDLSKPIMPPTAS